MKQVISGAFDTLSHAMEIYFGKPDENNLSDDINEAVMRSVIRNIRVLLTDPENYDARSELAWASAMAENGVLKIGKVTDFQDHQIEHQLGAYTNCNHGAGLAAIHPVLYRHIYKSGAARFARFAQNVWGLAPKSSDEETALAGIDALTAFIKEIGLPTTFTELGIPDDTDLRAVADSTNITAGYIADALGADTVELVPETPYSSDDLNWTVNGSHVNREHDDESLRDIALVADSVDHWGEYDTVFIGYPIWWAIATWPVNNFVKNNDFTGKTVITFCTSASSGLGQSGELLAEMAGTGDWQTGERFRSNASRDDVADWVSSLGLN